MPASSTTVPLFRRRAVNAAFLFLFTATAFQAVGQVTHTFSVSTVAVGTSTDSDFYIAKNNTNALGNDATLFAGNPSTSSIDRRAYLQFDLAGLANTLPVSSAKLWLWRNVTSTDTYGGAVVQRRTAAFVPGGASDFDELVGDLSSAGFADLDTATAGWVEVDVTEIVESWRASNLTNHFGFAIRGTEGYTTTGKSFSSRTGTNPPQLVVTQGSVFGVNYWPAGYSCKVLNNANWTAANKALVQQDLDAMASMGCGLIRLMFWPQESGFNINLPGKFNNDLLEQSANVVELIGFCRDRNMKVTIAFGNNWFDAGPTNNYLDRWWKTRYPNTTAGFTEFLAHTKHWIDTFVNSVEASPHASTLLYYDLENEWSERYANANWYAQYLFDYCAVPPAKKAYSILRIPTDSDALKVAMGNRDLRYTEFHSYPYFPANANIESAYDSVRQQFPNAMCNLGEYGQPCANSTQEAAQQTTLVDLVTRSKAKKIPYHMHWLWNDNAIQNGNIFGLNYSTHLPKDARGGLISVLCPIYNGDAEIAASGKPAFWSFGSSSGSGTTLASIGPDNADACTNARYARITRTIASGHVWMNAPTINVTGALGKKLYVNFFARSNMTRVRVVVSQYDSSNGYLAQLQGAAFNPSGSSFNNYLARVGSQSFTLNPNTRFVILSFVGTSVSNPSYLDVDTVSVFEQ